MLTKINKLLRSESFRKLIRPGIAVNGWPSLVCVILLIGGLQLCMGILGKDISRISEQVKRRPI